MLQYLFLFIVVVHGLIHLMGFVKAFQYGDIKNITVPVSRRAGAVWMIAAFLLLATAVLLLLKTEVWMYVALVAIVISQGLIISAWKDAKWGTIANLVILIVAFFSFTTWLFEKKFKEDVIDYFKLNTSKNEVLVTEADLKPLPPPVQQYLRYSGVVGKPYPVSMYVRLEGEMRSREKDWFYFTSEQYNFFEEPTRMFFMKAKMFGVTVPGCHRYEHQKAKMNIKLFGLFDIVKIQNEELTDGETVTVLNDMCLMAPASLLSKQLEWEAIDSQTAKVIFTNGAIRVSAVLYFNAKGQLIDFISNDRYEVNLREVLPFSTPVGDYQPMNGMNLISYGEAIWHYTDTSFVYGKFSIKEIKYNHSALK